MTSNLYAFGDFCMDPQNRVLRLRDEPIPLTPKAFAVLLLLVQHQGEVVSKNELMQAVWPDSFVEESNLTQTVFMLRKALGETVNQRYILTLQGRGYSFAPQVRTVAGNGHPPADESSRSFAQGTETPNSQDPGKQPFPTEDSSNRPDGIQALRSDPESPASSGRTNQRAALAAQP